MPVAPYARFPHGPRGAQPLLHSRAVGSRPAGLRGVRRRRWRRGRWPGGAGHPFRARASCVVRAFGVHEPLPPDQPGPSSAPANLVPVHREFSHAAVRPGGVRAHGRPGGSTGASVRGGQGHAPTTPDRSMTGAPTRP
ncbi:hypothetical protein F750_5194 [Streptomyces sp. PAMC 26508]|nr:hypothetical protein F750_5194 [Streptomyces sp. PAMC 26508]